MSNEYRFKDVETPSDIKAVNWYEPSQLIDTAKRVVESDSFSRNADRRINYTEWENEDLKPIFFTLTNSTLSQHDHETCNVKFIGKHRETKYPENWASEMWVDFVADTGDGGNATYTIAKTLMQESLAVTHHQDLPEDNPIRTIYPKGLPNPLPRADLLVMGGDLSYPVANEISYHQRFINFFRAALPMTQAEKESLPIKEQHATRAVVAFPQNHDWYDNLSIFSLIFCRKGKETFLDMKCPQEQSYAVVKLEFNWWLFGLDFSLSDDVDEIQFEYFQKIINNPNYLNKDSRVIVQYREPVWSLTALGNPKTLKGDPNKSDRFYRYELLEKLIEDKISHGIDIRLSGDQHYYRRYSGISKQKSESHLITCGSGGAFLHPTHGPEEFETLFHFRNKGDSQREFSFLNSSGHFKDPQKYEVLKYHKKSDYPSSETSWELSKEIFKFPIINWKFGIITALSYLFLVWANFSSLYSNIKTADFNDSNLLPSDFSTLCYQKMEWFHQGFDLFENMSCAWRLWSWSSILAPLNGIVGLVIIFGFYFFAQEFNQHAKKWAGVLGILHGLTHFFAVFVVYYVILGIQGRDPIQAPLEFMPYTLTTTFVLLAGYIVGSSIMGAYLFVSLNLYNKKVLFCTAILVFITIWFVISLWFGSCLWALIPTLLFSIPLIYLLTNRKKFKLENAPFLHSNEAFSSLKIEDYKGFLRFKITPERLEGFFIGIDNVPKTWKQNDPQQPLPKWEAVDKAIQPKLVDYWTVETPVKQEKQST